MWTCLCKIWLVISGPLHFPDVCPGWMSILVENKHKCEMAGITLQMDLLWYSRWYSHRIILYIQVNPRGSRLSCWSMGAGMVKSAGNVLHVATQMWWSIATSGSWSVNPISRNRDLSFKKQLKKWVTFAFSYPSSTVNSISLSFSGEG